VSGASTPSMLAPHASHRWDAEVVTCGRCLVEPSPPRAAVRRPCPIAGGSGWVGGIETPWRALFVDRLPRFAGQAGGSGGGKNPRAGSSPPATSRRQRTNSSFHRFYRDDIRLFDRDELPTPVLLVANWARPTRTRPSRGSPDRRLPTRARGVNYQITLLGVHRRRIQQVCSTA
jgi:hypothetical protein